MTTDPQTPVEELEGRELDKAVHREVFGWTFTEDMPVGTGEHVIDGDEEWRECHPTAAPLYSNDIDAVWEVVEAMNERGLWLGLGQCYPSDDCEGFTVAFQEDPRQHDWTERRVYSAVADTAPLAISRAALRAVRDK